MIPEYYWNTELEIQAYVINNRRVKGAKSPSIFNLFLFYAFKSSFIVSHIQVGTTGITKEYKTRCFIKKFWYIEICHID
jgi:hypothetical protein